MFAGFFKHITFVSHIHSFGHLIYRSVHRNYNGIQAYASSDQNDAMIECKCIFTLSHRSLVLRGRPSLKKIVLLGRIVMLAAAVIENVCSNNSTIFSTMRLRKRLQLQVIRGVITIYHLSAIHIYIETYSSKDYLYNCFLLATSTQRDRNV